MCKCTPEIKTPFCGRKGCEGPAYVRPVDKIVEAVRKDLLDRSNVGIEKYGTTLDQNKGDLRYWLNHAYEETLDKANYLKRAIMEIDAEKSTLNHIFGEDTHCQICGNELPCHCNDMEGLG
jgi:hypothetical protein